MSPPRDDLALAFVNTRYWRGRARPTETLATPTDLAAWWELESGETMPEPDGPAFQAALHLRETLHRIFAARAAAAAPAAQDIAALNAALDGIPPRRHLAWSPHGFAWAAAPAWPGARARLLWSAADLLAGPRRDRIRACDNPECRYLFLDSSKAGTRRWCDMASCGNRAKAHRHYRKRRDEKSGTL